jgi:6-phosphogluconolactonase (cycloisomerase 2 family)
MIIRGIPTRQPDLILGANCLALLYFPWLSTSTPAMSYKILVGGYTDGGLRVLTFDPSNEDKLKVAPHTIAAGSSPSWIARHPSDSSLVFAVNEVEDGRVIAIKLSGVGTDEEVTGEPVANVTSGGVPAHLLVMKDSIVIANVRI